MKLYILDPTIRIGEKNDVEAPVQNRRTLMEIRSRRLVPRSIWHPPCWPSSLILPWCWAASRAPWPGLLRPGSWRWPN